MNVERIRHIADVVEKQPHTDLPAAYGFCMSTYEHMCGSPSCIAGWAVDLYREDARQAPLENEETHTFSKARHIMGIDKEVAQELFIAWNAAHLDLSDITPAHAAAVLRNLADTGLVDWTVGAPESV